MGGKIEIIPDGPYILTEVTGLKGEAGPLEVKDGTALCRCGRSANKPYCDGTHNRVGVRDETKAGPSGKDEVLRYEGGGVTVLYNPRVCSHAAVCVRSLPQVFDPERKPWIEPEHADPRQVAAAVRGCPSGALQIDQGSGAEHLIANREPVEVQKDGPLFVTGPQLDGEYPQPGDGATRDKFVLCRCGLSGNKPYCDGSHHNLKWTARDEH